MCSGGFDEGADRFGDAPLTADDLAHIGRINGQLQGDFPVAVLNLVELNAFRMIYQMTDNEDQ